MKFVFSVIALSAFIALSSCYVYPSYATPDPQLFKDLHLAVLNDTSYSANTFGELLDWNFRDVQRNIWMEWVKCNQTFPVPHDEAKGLFHFDTWADKKSNEVNRTVASLVDCTLRATGVISDAGLNATQYMLQIRKLRYNHTRFDINQESMENKQQIWDTVFGKVKDLFCYASSTTTVISSEQGTMEFINYHVRSPDWRDNCYDLILSYAGAAQACKDVNEGDKIKKTWLIMKCIMTVNRRNNFRAPFYPFTLSIDSAEEANLVAKLMFKQS